MILKDDKLIECTDFFCLICLRFKEIYGVEILCLENFAEHLQFYTFNTFTSDTQVLPEYLGLAGAFGVF